MLATILRTHARGRHKWQNIDDFLLSVHDICHVCVPHVVACMLVIANVYFWYVTRVSCGAVLATAALGEAASRDFQVTI